jgi:hypothetical protein
LSYLIRAAQAVPAHDHSVRSPAANQAAVNRRLVGGETVDPVNL